MDADFVPLDGNDEEEDRFDYGDRETAEQIATAPIRRKCFRLFSSRAVSPVAPCRRSCY
jgi:hypothetical protein